MICKTNSRQGAAWSRPFVIVAICWFVSLIVQVIAETGMWYTEGLRHIVPMTQPGSPDAYDPHLAVDSDREKFRRELTPLVEILETPEAKVLAILEWVMNQVPKVENKEARSSWEMVELARRGGGLICGGLAQVFHDALIAVGIPARRLFLQREAFDLHNTHVTVESFVDGRWRLYDPTFHVSIKANGSRLGAFEARQRFMKGMGERVEVEFLGEVKYPARIEAYPLRYEVLFDNIYVELAYSRGIVRAIPIFGVWLGPQWGYPEDAPGIGVGAQNFYRGLYYTILLVLPAINLLQLLAVGLVWQKTRGGRQ